MGLVVTVTVSQLVNANRRATDHTRAPEPTETHPDSSEVTTRCIIVNNKLKESNPHLEKRPKRRVNSLEVRLVNGGTNCSGRVEIFVAGQWGTVCGWSWDLQDAQVVCRQMGCGTAYSATTRATFGEGTGPFWMNDVECTGNETELTQCGHSGNSYCYHYYDAGVICKDEPVITEMRLVNGGTNCSGRVEISVAGQWGTVCDNSWDLQDAQVVCRQMGCGTAYFATTRAFFGQGTGTIWMNKVACTGSETELTQCGHSGFGNNHCSHGQDVGVICKDKPVITDVRLVNGATNCSGRVEIFVAGQWGTVCDNSLDLQDAQVVCRQMGCGTAFSATNRAFFGKGTGLIWMYNVACTGSETELTQCGHSSLANHYCGHYQDTGVICKVITEMRLVNGGTNCSGRVEIFVAGLWGTVCHNSWDLQDAQVVCRQMGCGTAYSATVSAFFGYGTGSIWMNSVACTGNETELTQCGHSGFGNHKCNHGNDAGVICKGKNPGPPRPNPALYTCATKSRWGRGRRDCIYSSLESTGYLCLKHRIYFCCEHNRISSLVNVCRGLPAVVLVVNTVTLLFTCWSCLLDARLPLNARAGRSRRSAPLWSCEIAPAHRHYIESVCVVSFDITEMRLVNGDNSCSGRVEIFIAGRWGTVCDDAWDLQDAQVVCRQMGCGKAVSAPGKAHFGQGTGPVWMDNVACTGEETELFKCGHNGFRNHYCGHYEAASVICEVMRGSGIFTTRGSRTFDHT
ncbi:hypothetical protein WMY93_015122 [Mugilogobius chulae]|uniref:SRCR domain-containing protein n=1 Tax=Mugilogobius chulae TaxID=88201 RepID=A0AAW0P6A5_9GOBI